MAFNGKDASTSAVHQTPSSLACMSAPLTVEDVLRLERTECDDDHPCPAEFLCMGSGRRTPDLRREYTCALPCASFADCPSGLACGVFHDARETGDPARRGVCVPPKRFLFIGDEDEDPPP